jgi:hypothetical protein
MQAQSEGKARQGKEKAKAEIVLWISDSLACMIVEEGWKYFYTYLFAIQLGILAFQITTTNDARAGGI